MGWRVYSLAHLHSDCQKSEKYSLRSWRSGKAYSIAGSCDFEIGENGWPVASLEAGRGLRLDQGLRGSEYGSKCLRCRQSWRLCLCSSCCCCCFRLRKYVLNVGYDRGMGECCAWIGIVRVGNVERIGVDIACGRLLRLRWRRGWPRSRLSFCRVRELQEGRRERGRRDQRWE